MKTIYFYRTKQWGVDREFIHPKSEGDAAIIRQLTGQKTVNGVIRELIRDLSGGAVRFEELLPADR